MTTPTAPHPAAVALPAGAVYVDDWYHPDQLVGDPPSNGEPGSLRYFTGSEWTVERPEPYNADISVQLDGNQYADGPIERFIVLHGGERAYPGVCPAAHRRVDRGGRRGRPHGSAGSGGDPMTAVERPRVSPIVCAPWCTSGDGHADALFAEDQTCMGERHTVPIARDGDDGAQVGKRAGASLGPRPRPPDVAVNIEGQDIYGELHLTALEAFDLATALMDTVRTLTGEPTSDRPSLRDGGAQRFRRRPVLP